ncbi:MAG: LPS export ABC transporter permease LptF [Sulfurimicrobium sp.]|nr:LPS export ABC transporter permease LptF [Sulfurimicrobium sp.]MDP2197419.1 LPS export ABC transporter permease LptF [Sulfurimicrobium sp.]MDP3686279.1 LPS export ABC transporter permease LptF [Sulfurimicrobium sp.]MDZ7655397.1 LPS export ABC transporter permease LptF [Sulfurimicrobium sp.]
MIFRRALLHELLSNAAAVFIILLAISITTLLIRLLGQAASGSLASEAVLAFLAFSALNYLPVLLSLTLFIAVLLTLTRCYRDNEMVVWFSSGQSLTAFIRPVFLIAAPVALVVAMLSLFLSPWALQKQNEYRSQIESRDDVASIAPGVFKESKHADRVFFVESFAGEQNTVSNIFMQSTENQKQGVMFAQHGYQSIAKNGDRYLVLLNGRRYEGLPGSLEFKIIEFERYAVRIDPYEAKLTAPSAKSLSLLELINNKSLENIAEIQWRFSLPLSALLLALLAIPLSFVNPRAGRSLNLMLALVTYLIYNNCLSIAQGLVAQGKLAPILGLWLVHAALAALLLILFYRRLQVSPSLFERFRGTS